MLTDGGSRRRPIRGGRGHNDVARLPARREPVANGGSRWAIRLILSGIIYNRRLGGECMATCPECDIEIQIDKLISKKWKLAIRGW
jgi:hypothetical protein